MGPPRRGDVRPVKIQGEGPKAEVGQTRKITLGDDGRRESQVELNIQTRERTESLYGQIAYRETGKLG